MALPGLGDTEGDPWVTRGPGEGTGATAQLPAAEVSGAPGTSAERAAGVWRVAPRSGKACGSLSSRSTRFRRPLSSRISRSSWSTSGFKDPGDCSWGVRGAQAAGAAEATLPVGTRSPTEVALGTEVTDRPDVDTRDFWKESCLFPGAKAAACGPGAAVGEPANTGRAAGGVVPPLGGDGGGLAGRERGGPGGQCGEKGVGRAGTHRSPGAAATRCVSERCERRWPPRTSASPARRPRARGPCTRRPSRSGARRGCTCRKRTAAAPRACAGAHACRSAPPRRPPPRGPPPSAPAPGTALSRGARRRTHVRPAPGAQEPGPLSKVPARAPCHQETKTT